MFSLTNLIPTQWVGDDDFKVEYEVLSPIDISTITDITRREIALALQDVNSQVDLCKDEIAKLSAEIDKLTNDADGLDYAIAVASGIITGLIDSFLVGETDFNIDSVRKKLEEKYHTANDSAFQHKKTNKDGSKKNVSSPSLHRLEDMAHHPTLLGLVASIFVRFFRLAIFSNGDGKTSIFLISKNANPEKHKKEMTDMYISWSLAVLSGLLSWLANMAQNKYIEENGEDLPEPLKKTIHLIASAPAIVDIMLAIDSWLGHIMSDVSTRAGVPGIFLSLLKHISMLPILNKTELPHIVQKLYEDKSLNISEKAGVIFLALKNQSMPILINEILVRGFYFVRRLILEYKKHENFLDIDWGNIIPFGNRTVERMMTIASGTFTVVDIVDAAIRSGGFNAACLLRVNFVGIGRFVIAIGVDVGMGIKRSKLRNERIALYSEMLNLSNAKIFYLEADMWKEAENTEKAIQEAYQSMEIAITEFSNAWKEISSGSASRGASIDSIRKKNKDFAQELLEITEWGI